MLEKFPQLLREISYKAKLVMLIDNLQNDLRALYLYLEAQVQSDRQLQASIVGLFILLVLIILIKREWAKHEPHLTNLHQKNSEILQHSTGSNERLANVGSFTKHDYEKIQQYADEDPLTFVKKSN